MKETLTPTQLEQYAPSIFAKQPHYRTGRTYKHFSTMEVIEALQDSHWHPVWAAQQRVRIDHRKGFQKHLIRLRSDQINPGDMDSFVLELLLINSHDGTSQYQLMGGIWRFVCSNGMVVSDAEFGAIHIRHSGHVIEEVIEGSLKLSRAIPDVVRSIDTYRKHSLSEEEQIQIARVAMLLRYETEEQFPVTPRELLTVKRSQDTGMDLWTVFNRLQEHLVKGGIGDRRRANSNGRRFGPIRAIRGIDKNLSLNRQLWGLLEEAHKGQLLLTE